ncbi:MAG: hypothetical protein ACE5LU_08080, partial [Anaerolineae bacterium]
LADILRSNEIVTREQPASVIRTAVSPLDDRAVTGADLLIAVDMDPRALKSVQDLVPVILANTGVAQPTSQLAIQQASLPVIDQEHVEDMLAPVVVKYLGDGALAATRRLPILRRAYGERLINETSHVNGLYAFATGVAETVPTLTIPLNVADLVVLTKNQLIMVYKLALATGRPMSPSGVIGELLGVIGAGFLWRQIARELVGLIPVIGIVPKVAVAYGGTYAVGQAAQTYLIEGEVPAAEQLKTLYTEAIDRGRALAQSLMRRNDRSSRSDKP